MSPFIWISCLSLIMQVTAFLESDSRIVTLSYGSFQGKVSGGVERYFGIPYAAPPVGKLRFRPPQPPLPLEGVQNATKHSSVCMQTLYKLTEGLKRTVSEDCLYLDVWTPERDESSNSPKLPVMVWIYGGAFLYGSTGNIFYDGGSMVRSSDSSVVFVSMNYRLGAFGWLGSKELAAEGSTNLGLLDQEAALRWVKDHIEAFGGDKDRVTVVGESAGAMSIGAHLLANDGKQDLFHQAILESGSVLHAYPTIADAQIVYDKLLVQTGCQDRNDSVDCLRSVPAEFLLAATSKDFFSMITDGLYIRYQPTYSLLRGNFSRIPLLIGTNTDEGTYFTYKTIKTKEQLPKYYSDTVPYINERERRELLHLYPSTRYKHAYLAAADVLGDRVFQCPSNLMARMYANTGTPVYKYRWNHEFTLGNLFVQGNSSLGVYHFSEVPFVFDIRYMFLTRQEALLGRMMNSMWVQFVVTGNPNLQQDPYDNIIFWPRYLRSTDYEQVVFQTPISSVSIEEDKLRDHKCQFWDRVGRGIIFRKSISHVLY